MTDATRGVPTDTGQVGPGELEVLSGPEDGKLFLIPEGSVTIGRSPDNAICVPLELSVSRRHARLTSCGNEFEIEVLADARNPCWVRESKLLPGEKARIRRGECFQLGDVEFHLGPEPL